MAKNYSPYVRDGIGADPGIDPAAGGGLSVIAGQTIAMVRIQRQLAAVAAGRVVVAGRKK